MTMTQVAILRSSGPAPRAVLSPWPGSTQSHEMTAENRAVATPTDPSGCSRLAEERNSGISPRTKLAVTTKARTAADTQRP